MGFKSGSLQNVELDGEDEVIEVGTGETISNDKSGKCKKATAKSGVIILDRFDK